MPVVKLSFKPGVNRENTRYTTEGDWYASEKVRFRQGTPEKIGGWERISANSFVGLCRSLWAWTTIAGRKLVGVMTEKKPYIEYNGSYTDITAVSTVWSSPVTVYSSTIGSSVIRLNFNPTWSNKSQFTWVGSYIYLIDVSGIDANITASVLNNKFFEIIAYDTSLGIADIDVGVAAASAVSSLNINGYYNYTGPLFSNYYSQSNFGQDLLFCRRGGQINVWDGRVGWLLNGNTITFTTGATTYVTTTQPCPPGATTERFPVYFRSTELLPSGLSSITLYWLARFGSSGAITTFVIYTAETGGTTVTTTTSGSGTFSAWINARTLKDVTSGNVDVPDKVNYVLVSDIYRFVFAFGANQEGTSDTNGTSQIQPMLIRWSDQEDYTNWTPAATNQAGSLLLSRGSQIITALQARQEVLVWTDSALYSLQYQGAPTVWGAQLMGDNISIVSQNAVSYAAGAAFWMGVDKFYIYNGNVDTLKCDLRQYIFGDINISQYAQIFSGTNEGFNEVWWFYCSAESSTVNRYVIYNYAEKIWYYGTLARTAWLDSGLRDYPLAATYSYNLVNHEKGVDDNVSGTPAAITASIESAETDLAEDGNKFLFIRRVLPDITFRGSTAMSPAGVLTLLPLKNSGSGYNSPQSVAGSSNATVTRTATVPIEKFTGQVYIRIRARQLALKFESTGVGVQWQLGSMRLDAQEDGRASGAGVTGS
jgi:hypothetical protein